MKKIVILLVALACTSLMMGISFYPMTNVMSVYLGDVPSTPNLFQGMERLSNEYDDDELIIIKDDRLENTVYIFNVYFNGEQLLGTNPDYHDHEALKYGQPIWGKMGLGKYGTSPFYIKNITLNNNQITFSHIMADGYTPPTGLMVHYYIIEKSDDISANHSLLYSHSTAFDPQQQNYSHTITENITAPSYKAVVVIRDADWNILQAASTDRVTKPFRIATNGPISIVGGSESINYSSGYFYVINTDFDNEYTIDIHVQLVTDIMPAEWVTDFCDESACYQNGYADVTINSGSANQFYSTIYPLDVVGFATYRMTVSGNNHTAEIPQYFGSTEVDVFIIQDDGNEHLEQNIINTLVNTGLSYSFYYPHYGDINISNVTSPNIIWNVPAIYPAFQRDLLDPLWSMIENGKKLQVIGQYISLAMVNSNFIPYSNLDTILFLSYVLDAQIVSGDTNFGQINGSSFASGINFTLNNTHTSTNKISSLSGENVLFSDPAQNVKGVYSEVQNGRTILLDFDLHNIDNLQTRKSIIHAALTWFGTVSEDDNTELLPPPATLHTYPNPAKSSLNIEYNNSSKQNNTPPIYTIYNIRGQKVNSGELNKSLKGFQHNIDLNELQIPTGVYFIKINDDKLEKVNKVLILK